MSPENERKQHRKEKRIQANDGEAKRRLVTDVASQHLESGFSEEQQALDIEARSGDLYALKKSKGFQGMTASGKALAAFQTISGRLGDLMEVYTKLVEKDLHQAQKMLGEIKKIRAMQKVLLTKLFGQLNEDEEFDAKSVEKELQEILE